MTTYYHVTPHWDGGDLESLYALHGDAAYDMYADRWPDAGALAQYHVHVVHLYASYEAAAAHVDYYGGQLLTIVDPDDDLPIHIDDLEEGLPHPVSRESIPAQMVHLG